MQSPTRVPQNCGHKCTEWKGSNNIKLDINLRVIGIKFLLVVMLYNTSVIRIKQLIPQQIPPTISIGNVQRQLKGRLNFDNAKTFVRKVFNFLKTKAESGLDLFQLTF